MALVAMLVSTAAFAAEPLAYGDKAFMQIGPTFQLTELVTDMGKLKGREYGIKWSMVNPESGYAVHAAVSHANLKGAYDDFNNSLDGGSPTVTLELSKSFEKFDNGWQIGAYAKYQRYFGSIKGGEGGTGEYYSEYLDETVYEPWSDRSEIDNLQVMEAGLLVQKGFKLTRTKQIQFYVSPMLQVIKADLSYAYQSEFDSWSDTTKVVAKSGLGAVAGAVLNLNRDFSVQASATIKEHTTYSVGLNYAFDW